jgi:predicted P-loop ATPase
METIKLSMYNSVHSTEKVDISISEYCEMITKGKFQDIILKARLSKGNKEEYKKIKSTLPTVTGSAIMNSGSKNATNIKELNGLIVIDIDEDVNLDLLNKINKDQYTFICHRSVSGEGVCVFIKINPNKFLESFNDIAQYYWDSYNVVIDPSCKNKNRLRFLSFDPYLYINENSKKFIAKSKPKKEIKKQDFIFVENDFSQIIEKVKDLDLCQDDYKRYCDIGFSIGSKFGYGGLNYFKAICQSGSKYDPKEIEKHYKNFCKDGKITIATFYHYVKEAGIEIYSDQTKAIIKAVNVQKAQGTATLESVKKQLKILKVEADDKLINDLIESKTVYNVVEDLSNMAKLENFIVENYAPKRNTITNEIKIDGLVIDDHKLNSIYKTASKVLDFSVSKADVRDVINSDSTIDFNPLNAFFSNKEFKEGTIDSYINCVHPQSEYNRWAFKKWVVGCVHNWLSPLNETKVSPLTFVLCGQKQGTGKTSFFRNLLPDELSEYLIEKKIDPNEKDSMYNLAKGLICFDDEFGGLGSKDVKDFKRVADTNWIDIRLPYSAYYTKIKRKAGICGTTNEHNILKDVTGNRRLLPCNVESIDYEKMITIDTASLWREAFNLWRSHDYDWKIYTSQDLQYLNDNTVVNVDINPIEEMFFNFFSLEENHIFKNECIFNQGEILDYLNRNTATKVTKFDMKDIFTKNNIEYKVFRFNGFLKKGVKLYTREMREEQEDHDSPF